MLIPEDKSTPVVPPLLCKTCGKTYKGLGCQPCLLAASIREITKQQRTYVPMAVEGRISVTLARWRAGEFHIALYGDLTRAFCLKSLKGATRVRIPYDQINRPYETCATCVTMFHQSLREAEKERGKPDVPIGDDSIAMVNETTELTEGAASTGGEVPPWSDED